MAESEIPNELKDYLMAKAREAAAAKEQLLIQGIRRIGFCRMMKEGYTQVQAPIQSNGLTGKLHYAMVECLGGPMDGKLLFIFNWDGVSFDFGSALNMGGIYSIQLSSGLAQFMAR